MRQATDEAALLKSADQPMDPGFGSQVQRVLHFVEGRRDPGRGEPPVDEHQELMLLFGQHRESPRASRAPASGNKPKTMRLFYFSSQDRSSGLGGNS
jgi:hypothetical protein